MKRIIFMYLAFLFRLFDGKLYMRLVVAGHKSQGVIFDGMPEYIQKDAY